VLGDSLESDLLTEVRKLEVRLSEFVDAEEKAVKPLTTRLDILKELYNTTKELEEKPEPFKETLKLRMKANDKTIFSASIRNV
jgi:hypothetical protein